MLYIISTPIGNLKDITLRALDILKNVDVIFAEDTRRTGVLLKEYDIKNKLISYNDFNKKRRTNQAIELLKQGKDVALVSDAGTPGISDPGFYMIREAINEGIEVSPIPGASAVLSALVCSGLPTDKFGFFGFFPKKESKKKEILFWISKSNNITHIYYESPHRDRKSTRLNSSHTDISRMPSSA